MTKATLLVIQGIDQGSRFEIGEEQVGIGRGVQNALQIHDTEVSRSHAHIKFVGDGYVLSDLNSSNGTYLNGKVIRQCPIHGGDQIQVGRSIMLFSQPHAQVEGADVSDKVALLPEQDPEDRSSIVHSVPPASNSDLMALPADVKRDEVAQSLANLQVLYRISEEAVRRSIPIEQLLERILDLTIDVVGAHRGCVLISDLESGRLVPQVTRYRRGIDESEKIPISTSIVNFVLENGHGVLTSDAQRDTRFTPGQSIFQAGIREAICVPMQGRYNLVGVIYVDITTPPERVIIEDRPISKFNEDLLRLMIAIGRQSALAVEDNRYQQALVNAERLAAVGQTITTLSHHIKNILQGIRGGSFLIDLGLKDSNEDIIRKGWDIVEKSQSKIYNLVMDMLTFSKERKPAFKSQDLNETVKDVCELMQSRAEEFGVQLVTELSPEIPVSTFDPDGIHRAVLNIVTNALDAVEDKEPGQVAIKTGYDPKNQTVSVSVSDNGGGIAEGDVDKIFNIFESTKGARGTGLGLSVSRKIIREHGGDITVASEPEAGSTFTLCWPLGDEEPHND